MTPEQARAAARKVLGSVAQGEDPAADKANERRSLPLGDVAGNATELVNPQIGPRYESRSLRRK
jgi:hypothetical protein